MTPEDLQAVLVDFVAESHEHVDAFERSLLRLVCASDCSGASEEAFRAIHSLAGNASLLEIEPLEALAHMGETLLARLRGGRHPAKRGMLDALLGSVIPLRELIARIAAGGDLGASQLEVETALARLRPWVDDAGAAPLQPASLERGPGSKIHVNVEFIDHMMNLIGELVLVRNQIVTRAADSGGPAIEAASPRLDRVTSRLQDAIVCTWEQLVAVEHPRALSIVPALALTCAGQRFVMARANVVEVVHIGAQGGRACVRWLRGVPVLRQRGCLLPVIDLRAALGVIAQGRASDAFVGASVVVSQAGPRRFGLLVDAVHDIGEVVIKPRWRELEHEFEPFYAGATVLADGGVALILDALGLARVTYLARAEDVEVRGELTPTNEHAAGEAILICRSGTCGRVAIPLDRIARIELIDPIELIEPEQPGEIGGREVMPHRDRAVPLVSLVSLLTGAPSRTAPPREALAPVVILAHGDGERTGLVVGELIDVTRAELDAVQPGRRPGVSKAAVVDGQMTEFVDVDAVIARARTSPAALGTTRSLARS